MNMLELMTWGEIIENLKQEGNLKMATIFDLSGAKIVETEGAIISAEEAGMVLKCLDTLSTMIFGLFIVGSKFSCISVDKNTLMGQGEGDVFVAHRNRNLLICAISSLGSSKSCLGTVRNFVDRLVAEGAPEVSVPSLM